MFMHNFRKLDIWKEAIELVTLVYEKIEFLPKDEKFGLKGQIKRAVVSIPSNIAEGAGRNTDGEFNYFLGISSGSSYELETQLIVANKLNYLTDFDLEEVLDKLHLLQKRIYKFLLRWF